MRVTGPLLSLTARGSLRSGPVFARLNGQNIAKRRAINIPPHKKEPHELPDLTKAAARWYAAMPQSFRQNWEAAAQGAGFDAVKVWESLQGRELGRSMLTTHVCIPQTILTTAPRLLGLGEEPAGPNKFRLQPFTGNGFPPVGDQYIDWIAYPICNYYTTKHPQVESGTEAIQQGAATVTIPNLTGLAVLAARIEYRQGPHFSLYSNFIARMVFITQ